MDRVELVDYVLGAVDAGDTETALQLCTGDSSFGGQLRARELLAGFPARVIVALPGTVDIDAVVRQYCDAIPTLTLGHFACKKVFSAVFERDHPVAYLDWHWSKSTLGSARYIRILIGTALRHNSCALLRRAPVLFPYQSHLIATRLLRRRVRACLNREMSRVAAIHRQLMAGSLGRIAIEGRLDMLRAGLDVAHHQYTALERAAVLFQALRGARPQAAAAVCAESAERAGLRLDDVAQEGETVCRAPHYFIDYALTRPIGAEDFDWQFGNGAKPALRADPTELTLAAAWLAGLRSDFNRDAVLALDAVERDSLLVRAIVAGRADAVLILSTPQYMSGAPLTAADALANGGEAVYQAVKRNDITILSGFCLPVALGGYGMCVADVCRCLDIGYVPDPPVLEWIASTNRSDIA